MLFAENTMLLVTMSRHLKMIRRLVVFQFSREFIITRLAVSTTRLAVITTHLAVSITCVAAKTVL